MCSAGLLLLLLCGLGPAWAAAPAADLSCYSCEGRCECRQARTELCPAGTLCYTLKGMGDGQLLRKGCTADCKLVHIFDSMCSLCRGPLCNNEQSGCRARRASFQV